MNLGIGSHLPINEINPFYKVGENLAIRLYFIAQVEPNLDKSQNPFPK